ncbi:MAG: 23S rRNA (cytosine(2499)-C(5))-methyltransferase [Pleurocapsa sp. SU_196_0]|nr:23S rRNA (cytosine(2499)-C(5))-methyltransferase [Pleurocapsa sp. SU_196_0]
MSALPRLRLRVTKAAESQVRLGHPWVYSESILEQNREADLGELGVIFDRQNKFLAVGLYDPSSPLRLRVLHAGKPQAIDETWWVAHLERTVARREGLFDEATTGYRVINGESDGWPGLVLDRYADTLVLKIYTAAWFAHLDTLLYIFTSRFTGMRIVLRLSRNIQQVAGERFGVSDGDVLHGDEPRGAVIFLESGLRFEADVIRGQKTGFFLDQRENRRWVEGLAAGRRVLNAFSFNGGFSLYAARGGATSVVSADISAHALEGARRNFALNAHDTNVRVCAHETLQTDVFKWLREARDEFGLIVLDPPSLAKRETERARGIGAYRRLALDAAQLLEPDGVLVSASCSAHVSAPEFFDAVRDAADESGRTWTELRTAHHAPDHHASFVQAKYLKAITLRLK